MSEVKGSHCSCPFGVAKIQTLVVDIGWSRSSLMMVGYVVNGECLEHSTTMRRLTKANKDWPRKRSSDEEKAGIKSFRCQLLWILSLNKCPTIWCKRAPNSGTFRLPTWIALWSYFQTCGAFFVTPPPPRDHQYGINEAPDLQGQPGALCDPGTDPMGGLPHLPPAFQQGWILGNAGAIIQAQPCTGDTFSENDINNPACCWVRNEPTAGREAQALLVNYQHKVRKWYTSQARGTVRRDCMQMPFMHSCHSISVKWITLKAREKHLSNSSSPKPICLAVTVAFGD